MVIVDHNNAALKLVDTVSYVVSTTLRLTSKPRDVTVLSKLDAIAVTLTEECKIQFFSTRYYNTFDELTSLYVDGKCECIDFLNGKLYVSFLFTSPSRIDVMTLDGVVVKRLTRDQQGAPLLTWPDYLTVHEDYIFITNYWNNTVLKISPEGETVKTYVDSELRWPRGVTSTGDGHILICSRHTNNVHLMTTECEKVGVVLGPRDGLVGPWSVCYCPKSQTIYVSSYSRKDNSNNYLQVYRFK
ncbi:hypothetical protein DPMN_072882 [Dreissena polymorpha]|uniref:Uncharacterized protein n=1 Tax=Dreissena polymorpha TaxID=45954 RepID=A0A9D4BY51_DREPO|nr:hypothetical protein DPMN_072882 [Dreissena polymorpha]